MIPRRRNRSLVAFRGSPFFHINGATHLLTAAEEPGVDGGRAERTTVTSETGVQIQSPICG